MDKVMMTGVVGLDEEGYGVGVATGMRRGVLTERRHVLRFQ